MKKVGKNMKVDYKTVQQRRDNIMMLIQKLGHVTVRQLLHEFNVSDVTIRRDLQYWEDRGAIIKSYGGAKIVQHMVNPDNSNFTNARYKHAIAKYASSLVEEGDVIFVNTSSTALLMLEYLNKRCTVITNNAKAVIPNPPLNVSIILTGGELRYPKEAMVGDVATNSLKRMRANKCFLGCSGFEAEYGVSSAILAEVAVNEMMIQQTSGDIFVLCDYTKVGTKHSFVYADTKDINCLITDINADDEASVEIEQKGIKVVKLEPIPIIRK